LKKEIEEKKIEKKGGELPKKHTELGVRTGTPGKQEGNRSKAP